MRKNRMMRLASILLVCVLLTTSVISGTFAKYVTEAKTEDEARVAVWGINGKSAELPLFHYYYYAEDDHHTFSTVLSSGGRTDPVIAPGTTYDADFKIMWLTNEEKVPEVEFEFKFSVEGSSIHELIKENQNIQWRINWNNEQGTPVDGTWGTWDDMMNDLFAKMGAGDQFYFDGVNTNETYSCTIAPPSYGSHASDDPRKSFDTIQALLRGGEIEWRWLFEDANAGTENAHSYTVNGKPLTQDEYDTYMGNLAVTEDLVAKLVITMSATQVD